MKTLNKQELQQIAFNQLSDMTLYKKFTAKPYFLVIDTTPASGNLLRFSKNLLERI